MHSHPLTLACLSCRYFLDSTLETSLVSTAHSVPRPWLSACPRPVPMNLGHAQEWGWGQGRDARLGGDRRIKGTWAGECPQCKGLRKLDSWQVCTCSEPWLLPLHKAQLSLRVLQAPGFWAEVWLGVLLGNWDPYPYPLQPPPQKEVPEDWPLPQ